jgi:hypothetical protein
MFKLFLQQLIARMLYAPWVPLDHYKRPEQSTLLAYVTLKNAVSLLYGECELRWIILKRLSVIESDRKSHLFKSVMKT